MIIVSLLLIIIDINECSINDHICDHHCNNTIGSHECLCDKGYSLLSDNHTCEG